MIEHPCRITAVARITILALILTVRAIPGPAQDTVTGTGTALTGALLEIQPPLGDPRRLRLAGLLVPPPGTLCPGVAPAPDWECGTGSQLSLQDEMQGETVTCAIVPSLSPQTDPDAPPDAECHVQTRNLNIRMLETGWAILRPAYRGRNAAYDAAEHLARRTDATLWGVIGHVPADPDRSP